jgi:hypothetical protein
MKKGEKRALHNCIKPAILSFRPRIVVRGKLQPESSIIKYFLDSGSSPERRIEELCNCFRLPRRCAPRNDTIIVVQTFLIIYDQLMKYNELTAIINSGPERNGRTASLVFTDRSSIMLYFLRP